MAKVYSDHKFNNIVTIGNTASHSDDALVLLVDDSRFVKHLVSSKIDRIPGIRSVIADSMEMAEQILEEQSDRFYLAITGLALEDSPNGEIVGLIQSFNIPVIVMTSTIDKKIRKQILKKNVIDYVLKKHMSELEYVIHLADRIHKNGQIKVLIVDDSKTLRHHLERLLKNYNYITLIASDGMEALQLINEHPDISLVLTDYNMPNMDGMTLIQKIREDYSREDMSIIGLSDSSQSNLSAKLLKAGANDFINKPFEIEEFFCRITQNTNMINYVRQIKDSSTRDFLTQAYNRRHLYTLGEKLHDNAKRGNIKLAVALIDADHFKKINDTWGHHIGDEALIALSQTMRDTVRESDIVARFGGEEFVILALIEDEKYAIPLFEKIRQAVEKIELHVENERIHLTVSIGVTTELGDNLDAMIQLADESVYKAKESGRNRVEQL